MGIPFFNKKKKNTDFEEEVFLTLDIGTEYVKSVIYQYKDGIAHIVGYSKVKQHSKAMEGALIINIENVSSACDRGIGEALAIADNVLGRRVELPRFVTMGISGELVKGVSILANYEREDPNAPITEEETSAVVESVKEQAFPESIDDIAEEIGTDSSKIKEVNSHINSTYIDGVKIDNPVGFTGKEVSYRVYSTFAPSLHVNSLFEIADRLELDILTIDVQPYAISKTFKDAHKSDFSKIFIDIGGGTTDIAVVENGGIIGTKMMAFGGRVFTRRIAKELNIDMNDAERMKLDYSNLKLQDITEKKIKKAIENDSKLWVEGVELSLKEFKEIESFPTEILLSGGGSELPEIKDILLSYPWLTVMPFERFPKIRPIYPNQIENIEDHTELMISTSDVAPAALTSITLELLN